jgi:hypothetical protein
VSISFHNILAKVVRLVKWKVLFCVFHRIRSKMIEKKQQQGVSGSDQSNFTVRVNHPIATKIELFFPAIYVPEWLLIQT